MVMTMTATMTIKIADTSDDGEWGWTRDDDGDDVSDNEVDRLSDGRTIEIIRQSDDDEDDDSD